VPSRCFGSTFAVTTRRDRPSCCCWATQVRASPANVKVTFDPAPPSTRDIKEVLEILERGIAAVAPGRELEWVLGAAHNTVDWNVRNEYKVRIEGEGPFGPLEPVEFVIIVNDLKGSHAAAAGNLRAVALQIQEITKATNQLNGSIRKLQPVEPPIPMEPETIKPSN
jgi:hypothetical protein